LALMKIISWNDRYSERDRDAKDLALLRRTYLDAGNVEHLNNEEADLVERESKVHDAIQVMQGKIPNTSYLIVPALPVRRPSHLVGLRQSFAKVHCLKKF